MAVHDFSSFALKVLHRSGGSSGASAGWYDALSRGASDWDGCGEAWWSLRSPLINSKHGFGAVVYLVGVLEIDGCDGSEEVVGESAECKAFGSIVWAAEWVSACVVVGSCNSEGVLLVSIRVVEHFVKFRNGNIWGVEIAI